MFTNKENALFCITHIIKDQTTHLALYNELKALIETTDEKILIPELEKFQKKYDTASTRVQANEIYRWFFLLRDVHTYFQNADQINDNVANNSNDFISSIPNDVVCNGIFKYLSKNNLGRLACVSTEWNTKVQFFKTKHERAYNALPRSNHFANYSLSPKKFPLEVLSPIVSSLVLPSNRMILGLKNGDLLDFRLDKFNSISMKTFKMGHNDRISKILALSDNRLLSASDDKLIIVWKLEKDEYHRTQSFEHDSGVTTAALLSNGDIISTSGLDLKIWRINDKEYSCIQLESSFLHHVSKITPLKDGFVCTALYTFQVWILLETNEYHRGDIVDAHLNLITSLISPDDKTLITSSFDQTINIWHRENDKYTCTQTLNKHVNIVNKVVFLEKNYFLSCSNDTTIMIWHYDGNQVICTQTLEGHKHAINDVIVLGKNEFASISYDQSTIKIWRRAEHGRYSCSQTLTHDSGKSRTFKMLPNQMLMCTGATDMALELYSFPTLEAKIQCCLVKNPVNRP